MTRKELAEKEYPLTLLDFYHSKSHNEACIIQDNQKAFIKGCELQLDIDINKFEMWFRDRFGYATPEWLEDYCNSFKEFLKQDTDNPDKELLVSVFNDEECENKIDVDKV